MNWIDIAAIILLIISAIVGLKRGLVGELFGLLGMVIGLVLARRYCNDIYFINSLFKNSVLSTWVSFTLIFVGVILVASLIGILIHKVLKLAAMGMLDHIGGFIFGLLKGILIIGILLFLLSKFTPLTKLVEKSVVASKILEFIANLFQLIKIPHETTEYI